MATIRVPESCADLLQFVKKSPRERKGSAFFPTYAHLVACAAGLAVTERIIEDEPEFRAQDPRPIEWGTFKSQDLEDVLLAFVVASAGDVGICESVDEICQIVERLADAGLKRMREILEECGGPVYFPQEWERMVLQMAEEGLELSVEEGDS